MQSAASDRNVDFKVLKEGESKSVTIMNTFYCLISLIHEFEGTGLLKLGRSGSDGEKLFHFSGDLRFLHWKSSKNYTCFDSCLLIWGQDLFNDCYIYRFVFFEIWKRTKR